MAGLFHPLLCSFCGFTALFPKGTVLLQLLFACLFQGVTIFCVFPVVDRQCLVLDAGKKNCEFSLAGFVCVGFVLWLFVFCFPFSVSLVKTPTFNFRFTSFANS